MPAVKTLVRSEVPGARRQVRLDFTPNNVYPAGGEPLVAADFGLTVLDDVTVADNTTVTALHAKYDPTNGRLRLYTSATGAEVANGSDQSVNKFRLIASGI